MGTCTGQGVPADPGPGLHGNTSLTLEVWKGQEYPKRQVKIPMLKPVLFSAGMQQFTILRKDCCRRDASPAANGFTGRSEMCRRPRMHKIPRTPQPLRKAQRKGRRGRSTLAGMHWDHSHVLPLQEKRKPEKLPQNPLPKPPRCCGIKAQKVEDPL